MWNALILIGVTVLAQISLAAPTPPGSLTSVILGNGTGAQGAGQEGTDQYYWFDPSYLCPAGTLNAGTLPGYRSSVRLGFIGSKHHVLFDPCTQQTEYILEQDFTWLESFSRMVAGAKARSFRAYQDGIYETIDTGYARPDQFIDLWCGSSDGGQFKGLEVLIETQNGNNTAHRPRATLIFQDPKPLSPPYVYELREVNPLEVNRTDSETDWKFSAPGFSLSVDLVHPSFAPFWHPARLEANIDGLVRSRPLDCRIGKQGS